MKVARELSAPSATMYVQMTLTCGRYAAALVLMLSYNILQFCRWLIWLRFLPLDCSKLLPLQHCYRSARSGFGVYADVMQFIRQFTRSSFDASIHGPNPHFTELS